MLNNTAIDSQVTLCPSICVVTTKRDIIDDDHILEIGTGARTDKTFSLLR